MATLLSAGELQLSLFSQMLPLGIPRLQGWIVCKIPRCWRATEEVEVKENPREEELLKRNSVLRRTVAAGRELQSRDVSEKKRIFRPQESFPTDNPKMVQPVGAGSGWSTRVSGARMEPWIAPTHPLHLIRLPGDCVTEVAVKVWLRHQLTRGNVAGLFTPIENLVS